VVADAHRTEAGQNKAAYEAMWLCWFGVVLLVVSFCATLWAATSTQPSAALWEVISAQSGYVPVDVMLSLAVFLVAAAAGMLARCGGSDRMREEAPCIPSSSDLEGAREDVRLVGKNFGNDDDAESRVPRRGVLLQTSLATSRSRRASHRLQTLKALYGLVLVWGCASPLLLLLVWGGGKLSPAARSLGTEFVNPHGPESPPPMPIQPSSSSMAGSVAGGGARRDPPAPADPGGGGGGGPGDFGDADMLGHGDPGQPGPGGGGGGQRSDGGDGDQEPGGAQPPPPSTTPTAAGQTGNFSNATQHHASGKVAGVLWENACAAGRNALWGTRAARHSNKAGAACGAREDLQSPFNIQKGLATANEMEGAVRRYIDLISQPPNGDAVRVEKEAFWKGQQEVARLAAIAETQPSHGGGRKVVCVGVTGVVVSVARVSPY